VRTTVREADSGPHHEALHGARHQHLGRPGADGARARGERARRGWRFLLELEGDDNMFSVGDSEAILIRAPGMREAM
jgi:hypothetical protein